MSDGDGNAGGGEGLAHHDVNDLTPVTPAGDVPALIAPSSPDTSLAVLADRGLRVAKSVVDYERQAGQCAPISKRYPDKPA
jgi:hypothetical protein